MRSRSTIYLVLAALVVAPISFVAARAILRSINEPCPRYEDFVKYSLLLDRLYIDRAFRFHLAYVNRDSDSAIILIPNDQLHDDKNLVSLVPQFWKSSLEPWGIVATHQSPNNSEVLIIMVGNPTILGYRQFDRSTVGTYSDLVDKMKWQANEIVHMHLKVSGGNTTTYNWDFESNLIGIDFPGTSNDDSHEYDRAGRRIRSKLNGASDAALPWM